MAVLSFGLCHWASAEVTPGEIAFAEMNCVACHQASPTIAQRLASRKSPQLGQSGSQLSPTWLRDFLLNPQKEKSGNLMPDMLHGLSAVEKSAAADALTHYLVSLQPADTNSATRLEPAVVVEGGELFHKVGCVACHAPQELPVVSTTDFSGDSPKEPRSHSGLAELATNSIPLGELAKKYTVNSLAAFLRDPLKSRPSGRMPRQRLDEKESRAIAMYLLRDQPAPVPQSKIPGLNYEAFEGLKDQLPDYSKLKAIASGYATNLSLEGLPRRNATGLRLRGQLTIPREGDYTFWTLSRDGSQLFVDGKLVVNNDGVHKPTEKEGRVKLSVGDHSLTVNYFHHSGPAVLKAMWSGPGIKKQEIPNSAISLADNGQFMHVAGEQPFVLDATKVAKGQHVFEQYNCGACHEVNQPGRKAKPLEKLAGKNNGCLASKPAARIPSFALTEKQRAELRALLTNLSGLEQPLAPADQVHRTMTALNCYACHGRDGQGAPTGLRRAYFKVNGTADLGEEGSVPPHLNGVGAKLKPAWLEKVLVGGVSVRPYMATRMPQFGEANVKALAAAFRQADAGQKGGHDLSVDPAFANGLRLVGNEGLSCIACHNFAGHPSLGVPALDITTAPERLNSDWFRRYLLDPAKLRPGTRMPQFWPGGVAANKTILEGNTENQITAIWSYLSSPTVAKNLPPGLLAPKMELVPKREPLIYRNFIEGAGSRAIGVGYPEKVNLAFDANQMCIDLLWHGQFMDASHHWTGRGEGSQPPLGYSVLKFTPGVPFAVLDDSQTPWPKTSARAVGYQFKGYMYDDRRRPQFRYMFGDAEIAEFFLPEKFAANAETGLRRTLTLHAAKPMAGLWFRAALADKVEELGQSTYLVDGSIRLAFPFFTQKVNNGNTPSRPQITVRMSAGKYELLVPVIFESGAAEIMEEISW